MRRYLFVLSCIFIAQWSSGCTHQDLKARQAGEVPKTRQEAIRVSGDNKDAAEPAMAAASDGSVYLVWVEHDADGGADVMLAGFDAKGKSNGPAMRINSKQGEAKAWRGDPPTVGVAPDGTVYVGWTARVPPHFDGTELFLSASRDKGASFDLPVKVNDDQKLAVNGMHSLAIAPDGSVFMSWLGEPNKVGKPRRHKKGHKHGAEPNRELFVSSSNDRGKNFSGNRLVSRDACPCCKTSLAVAPDQRIYVSWRQVLPGNLRHIAVASSSDQGQTYSSPVVVSDDRWMIAGCPVSGSSLSVSGDGKLQIVWYSAGEAGPTGIYRSESQDAGKSFTPRQLIAEGQAQGTPVVLAHVKGDIAVWQKDLGASAQVVTASLDDKLPATTGLRKEANSELPAASLVNDQIRIAYVREVAKDQRSVWLLRMPAANTR